MLNYRLEPEPGSDADIFITARNYTLFLCIASSIRMYLIYRTRSFYLLFYAPEYYLDFLNLHYYTESKPTETDNDIKNCRIMNRGKEARFTRIVILISFGLSAVLAVMLIIKSASSPADISRQWLPVWTAAAIVFILLAAGQWFLIGWMSKRERNTGLFITAA